MRHYETIYVVNPNLSDEEYRTVVDRFSGVVEQNRGEIIRVQEWGKKPLAYDLKKSDKGSYVFFEHCSEPATLREFERSLKLDDRVLKYQTVKLSDKPDPAALKARAKEAEEKSKQVSEATEMIENQERPAEQDIEGMTSEEEENGDR